MKGGGVVSKIRSFLLRFLLGKSVTVFVDIKESGTYEVEFADSRRRKQLLVAEIERITPIRYRLKGYRPS